MPAESASLLVSDPGGVYVDGTLGYGGHSQEILKILGPGGKLIGIDCDPAAITSSRALITDPRFTPVPGFYQETGRLVSDLGIERINGLLLDLGVSSPQLDVPERGFSFRFNAPLDMRMSPDSGLTAADIVNNWSRDRIFAVLRNFGEEPKAGRIADRIVRQR
ncbi:MAG: 16S rRNA (cytosine(1402)-N(4))-methyltransferase, partial [Candidatus Wallbacteria bacterium]|nr:16S rRNA (cytosine(1402)-N(4))-methyltransferase [Candidatus Wallbacteria bacterium]